MYCFLPPFRLRHFLFVEGIKWGYIMDRYALEYGNAILELVDSNDLSYFHINRLRELGMKLTREQYIEGIKYLLYHNTTNEIEKHSHRRNCLVYRRIREDGGK